MGCFMSSFRVSTVSDDHPNNDSIVVANNFKAATNGVSVHWLQNGLLEEIIAAGYNRTDPIYVLEDLNQSNPENYGFIRSKTKNVHCPADDRLGASYVDCLENEDEVGPANIMLSYGWGNSIGDIVDTLVEYCTSNHLDMKRTYVWICFLCVNQHRVSERKEQGEEVTFEEFRAVFQQRVTEIRTIVAMLSPWNQPVYLTRCWCIFELFEASKPINKCNVAIAMPPKEKKEMIDALSDINILYDALSSTKIQNAQASETIDRQRILNIVEMDGGFESFNNHINDLLRDWIKNRVLEVVQGYEEGHDDTNNSDIVRDNHRKLDSVDFAALCSRIGVVLNENGESDEAFNLQQKSLVIRKRELKENHPLIGISHNHLAAVLERKGDYEASLAELDAALHILQKSKNEYPKDLAKAYHDRGYILSKQGKDDEALKFYKQSLSVQENQETQDTATCYNNMATSLRSKNRLDEALEICQKALDIRLRLFGDSHPDVAMSQNHIGRILGMKHEHSEALSYLNKALKIRQRILGEDHRETATSYHNVGYVHGNMKEYDEALKMLRKGLQIRLDVLGLYRRATADSYEGIGIVLKEKGGCDVDALAYLEKAHEIRVEVLGENHIRTIELTQMIEKFRINDEKS